MFVDCHTHLDQYPDAEIAEIVSRAEAVGVGAVVIAGTTLKSSARAAALTDLSPALYAGIGIHPTELTGPVDDDLYRVLGDLAAGNPKVVVVSETGLDFMEGSPDRAVQGQAFRRHIGLARELGLPVVFHSRESHSEALRVLREERIWEVGGVFHYFQGDEETALRAIDLGLHISLARPLSRLDQLQEAARRIPLESIVLESDAYPQPFKKHRKNWTEPRHIAEEVAPKLAELRGIAVEEVERACLENILKVAPRLSALAQRQGP